MRKVLKFLMCFFALTCMCVATGCTGSLPWDNDYVDSTDVATQIEAVVNPQFSSAADMISFQQQDIKGYEIDSVFRQLPQDVLQNVATVLINKAGVCCKSAVVQEYLDNRAVYDNLQTPLTTPNPTTPSEENTGASDLGTKSAPSDNVFKTSINYRTDTVDGKPRKVQIKTEESYIDEG